MLVSDHYYTLSSSLLTQYLAPGSENAEPVPSSALINGRSRRCDSSKLEIARFTLDPEANTRLRIINVGAFAEFALQIDEHEVQVTEVDGTDVLPQSVHRLNVLPAQRYSVIVSPPSRKENKGLYWIRARMVTHCFAYEQPELQEEVRAVLDYQQTSGTSADDGVPESKDWPEIIDVECRDMNTSTLVPVTAIPAPEIDPRNAIFLRSTFQIRDWRLSRGYFNDSSFRVNATKPILQTLLGSSGGSGLDGNPREGFVDENEIRPEHSLVYRTTGTRTITLLIQNFDDGAHPMHLHGYKFFVLGSGHGYPPLSLLQKQSPESSPQLNLENPLRRDTATVEAYGWLLISFVADNPGVWAFHCHIGWHAEAGLMMVFATEVERIGKAPEEVGQMCKMEGVERGMGPSDDMWIGHIEEEET
ncbi:multicopper oxidase [Pyrenophora seminiperda CCB06]|uniref:Multicopper oxidase n=1 Tax=Pyrenophora seminiperda CCB06 TaxID=1302712 RepID=A0A3M7M341_9PLEO|nr:multicopper oxidase [Pyrenophora seminiperda CCB06]